MEFLPKNLDQIFTNITDYWSPVIIGQVNNLEIKAAKIKGEFIWHYHDDTDELFYIYRGNMTLKLRDLDIHLKEKEFFTVPKGMDHKPVAPNECHIILMEKAGTVNTGNIINNLSTEGHKPSYGN